MRTIYCIAFLLLFCNTNAQVRIPDFQEAVANHFKAGVNISYFEKFWKEKAYRLANYKQVIDKISLAHQLGFTSIRLPVSFDDYLKPGTNKIDKDLLFVLTEIFDFVESKNMVLNITYHSGTIYKKQDIQKEAIRIAAMWSQIVAHFKGKGYDRLFFGLYNDPRLEVLEWRNSKRGMMALLRPKDLDRYWIIGSTNYNGINALLQMKVISNDSKIIYAFHFFEPYIFTHQGAAWDLDKTYITNLPFPYSNAEMPSKPKRKMSSDMIYNYEHYSEKANQAFIEGKIRSVYDWMMINNVPVICTETGSIASIPLKFRENYFKDVMNTMRQFGIPAMIWDLDKTFKIIDDNKRPLNAVSIWLNSFENQ